MSKVITSPVDEWPGTVTLHDPLTFPQRFAFEDALTAARELREESEARFNYALLPGVLACVESFQLSNFPTQPAPDNWPSTPKEPTAKLVAWLVGEIAKLYEAAAPPLA